MFADRKRRQFSYVWSLPVVVSIMFFAAAKLVALQRAEVIAEFANQVAHSETEEATSAVRQLASMPRPPLGLLVEAAASPNLDVAREAQFAIDEYLRFCQREIKAGRRVKVVAAQLTVLAESLACHRATFSVIDHPWVERTTRKVLHLANGIPSQTTPILAAHCDEILAAVSANQSLTTAPATAKFTGASIQPSRGAQIQDESRLTAMAVLPWSDYAGHPGVTADLPQVNSSASFAAADARSREFSISLQRRTPNDEFTAFASPDEPTADVLPDSMSDSGWREQWSHPLLRTLPAMPISATPISDSQPSNELDSGQAQSRAEPIAPPSEPNRDGGRHQRVDSRRLLERWLVAEGTDVYPLEVELTRRGFGRLSARFVERLFSDDAEDRLRLVDDVLTEPGVDARPWLLLLADDSDPDVRLVVITMMATSNDPALIEKAWQVAIHDRDPRIAGMATRLRERRSESQRR